MFASLHVFLIVMMVDYGLNAGIKFYKSYHESNASEGVPLLIAGCITLYIAAWAMRLLGMI